MFSTPNPEFIEVCRFKNQKEFMADLKRVYKAVKRIWLKPNWIPLKIKGSSNPLQQIVKFSDVTF